VYPSFSKNEAASKLRDSICLAVHTGDYKALEGDLTQTFGSEAFAFMNALKRPGISAVHTVFFKAFAEAQCLPHGKREDFRKRLCALHHELCEMEAGRPVTQFEG
jgi:hypothetical protein